MREAEQIGILLNEGKKKSGKCGLDKEKESQSGSDGGREGRLHAGRNKSVLARTGGKRLVFWTQEHTGFMRQQQFTMVTVVSTKIA